MTLDPAIDPAHLRLAPPGTATPRYRICTRCIMDSSDPEITFDDEGICHHCRRYERTVAAHVRHGDAGRAELAAIARRIAAEGEGRPYDCVIGLSGGIDSTYVAYLTKQLGLRPLAVHVDNGWNSETAVRNIESVVTRLGIDLHTEVLDWEEFRSLQVAVLRASTPDCEIPTDHAIGAVLYRTAIRHGIRHIIHGSNLVTEQMVPRTWSAGHTDWQYIAAVNRQFGDRRLATYPHYTQYDLKLRFPVLKRIRQIFALNFVDYDKSAAIELMQRELGWASYGGKHHESIYTRFYQTYLLPRKFGIDKRRPHLSCLINSGQITRDQALAEMQQPPLAEEQTAIDRAFVIKKLGLGESEFTAILAAPPLCFWDYPSDERFPPGWEKVQIALTARLRAGGSPAQLLRRTARRIILRREAE
jgi:N-acetyl sugar amidotransferase